MQKFGVFLAVVAIAVTAQAPFAQAGRERESVRERLPLNDPRSLASPDYEGYRPAWANPYAEPGEIGVNDDPTPFYPSDVNSGGSLFDNDNF
jgi:hypothetical protein